MAEDSARVARGGSWLIEPVGASPQFTGADFTQDDVLYAKTAEDFVRNEVLTRLDEIEAKQEGLIDGTQEGREVVYRLTETEAS